MERGWRIVLLALAAIGLVIAGAMKSKNRNKREATVGIPGYWGALMPPLQNSAYGNAVLQNQFDPLVRRGRNGLIEPLAAKSWEVSPDYRIIRFKIDTARRFSDGSRLTAADFKRSWEDGLRMKARASNKSVEDALYKLEGYKTFDARGEIEGIKAIGEDVLELRFTEPARVPLGYLSGARYAAYKQVGGRAIGTGPYVMEEAHGKLLLIPNRFYRGPEKRFDRLRIVVTPNDKVPAALRSGTIDGAIFAEAADLPECADPRNKKIRCVYSEESDHVAVRVNGLPGRLFADEKNRLALQAVIHDEFAAHGVPPVLGVGNFVNDPQSFLRFQAGRLTDAKARQAYQVGRQFLPRLVAASKRKPVLLVSNADCAWLIGILRRAGITVAARSGTLDFSLIQKMTYQTHEADLILGIFSVYNGDPDGLYHLLGKHGAIFSKMCERKDVVDLLESGRRITDRRLLSEHYQKVARAIIADVPYVHLGFRCRRIAYNPAKTRISDNMIERNSHRITLFEPR